MCLLVSGVLYQKYFSSPCEKSVSVFGRVCTFSLENIHAAVVIQVAWAEGKPSKWSTMGPCALHHCIQNSMEAILACHPALSTKWLDWVAISRILWRAHRPHCACILIFFFNHLVSFLWSFWNAYFAKKNKQIYLPLKVHNFVSQQIFKLGQETKRIDRFLSRTTLPTLCHLISYMLVHLAPSIHKRVSPFHLSPVSFCHVSFCHSSSLWPV